MQKTGYRDGNEQDIFNGLLMDKGLDMVDFFQGGPIGPKFWPNSSKVLNVQIKFKIHKNNLFRHEANMFRILAFRLPDKQDWTPNGQRKKSGLLMDI